jgi:hypothetical protein
MGLETRRGWLYYYQKLRIGRRVVSVYGGGGDVATLCADLQALETDRADERRWQRTIPPCWPWSARWTP